MTSRAGSQVSTTWPWTRRPSTPHRGDAHLPGSPEPAAAALGLGLGPRPDLLGHHPDAAGAVDRHLVGGLEEVGAGELEAPELDQHRDVDPGDHLDLPVLQAADAHVAGGAPGEVGEDQHPVALVRRVDGPVDLGGADLAPVPGLEAHRLHRRQVPHDEARRVEERLRELTVGDDDAGNHMARPGRDYE